MEQIFVQIIINNHLNCSLICFSDSASIGLLLLLPFTIIWKNWKTNISEMYQVKVEYTLHLNYLMDRSLILT